MTSERPANKSTGKNTLVFEASETTEHHAGLLYIISTSLNPWTDLTGLNV